MDEVSLMLRDMLKKKEVKSKKGGLLCVRDLIGIRQIESVRSNVNQCSLLRRSILNLRRVKYVHGITLSLNVKED